MDLNKAKLNTLLLFLVISIKGYAQHLELGINQYTGIAYTREWEAGFNGFSLDIDYFHSVGEKITLKGGVELGYTGWGSQGLMAIGFRYGEVNSLDVAILNGMAFYQQGPAYVFGSEAFYTRSFFNEGKNRLLISIGLRYSIQPAYSAYSSIYSYLDLPLRFRWGRILK